MYVNTRDAATHTRLRFAENRLSIVVEYGAAGFAHFVRAASVPVARSASVRSGEPACVSQMMVVASLRRPVLATGAARVVETVQRLRRRKDSVACIMMAVCMEGRKERRKEELADDDDDDDVD